MDYQWYPGHMTKARRMMQENIGLVDLVIELADARIPLSSRNPDIDALAQNKARILLMTKADMADPVRTALFQRYFEEKGFMVIAVDARTRKANEKIRAYVEKACAAKRERDKRRGIIGRPLRAMVVGIPNVGKSTFINSFAGKASAKTGNKPGVTRGKQWIRLNKNLELLDTPGILWPRFSGLPAEGISGTCDRKVRAGGRRCPVGTSHGQRETSCPDRGVEKPAPHGRRAGLPESIQNGPG